MNSKQRAKIAFERGTPDRPALGFFAIDSGVASQVLGRETYWRAKAKAQIAFWEGRRDEVVQSWIEDSIELYRKLDLIDIVPTAMHMAGICPPKDYDPNPPRRVDDATWEDKQGRVYKYSDTTKDITMVHDPEMWSRPHLLEEELAQAKTTPPDESIFEAVDAIIAALGEDRFILGPASGLEGWALLGGMERGFMEIAQRPDEVKQIYRARADNAIAMNAHYVRPGQDGVLLGTDYASTQGPMISPDCYRDLFLDAHRDFISDLKKRGMTVVHHACGNNWPLLDIFVDMGVDCYQSIQATAGMDLVEVQRKYGDKMAVWGGVQVEHLIDGTPDEVRADVRRVMTEAAPHGGLIVGTSHSVAVGSKYDNFMAMMDEFAKLTS